MGLLNQALKRYVKSNDNKDDIKRLIDEIYFKSKYHFSNVIPGDHSIIFTNSFLRNLFSNYEKFGEISEGTVNFEPKENYFIVHSKINLARFIIIYATILVIGGLSVVAFATDTILFASTACLLLFVFIVMCSQFAASKFNNMITSCIKECGLKMK